ncbi:MULTISPECIES: DUF7146 domain-containing protein [Sphingomonas]|jgi:putative DNA primase/helicase|uniref:Uncharacterized protein n=1 Tax=Sphingomonas turrisvirgatae TaxID=1888892 RepID=A0A1E3LYI5_9SPHN|nr:toprim domain-containing protein [Sphingomonas turrisvirgatae]ODP38818.1 hypothetical protein BFL28_13595 [Sphingomonas turrisvirgatae]
MPIVRTIPELEEAAARILHSLGGRWRRGGAMCHCPAHDDRTPSLSVRVGTVSLLFKCFAGCETADVIREIRQRRLAVPADRSRMRVEPGIPSAGFADQARKIWNESAPLVGTPAALYLAGRTLDANSSALRYHASTPLGRRPAVRFRPALIAAVRQDSSLVAVQRSFIHPAGAGLATGLVRPKLTLGRPLRGAVQLAPAGPALGLAEGVESALSAIRLLGIPVWATLGGERLSHIAIPASVRRLVLLPDADLSGRRAERKARDAYARLDIVIETIWPWFGQKDWNDALVMEGEREAGPVRHAV